MNKTIFVMMILMAFSVHANCQNVDLESLIPVPLLENFIFFGGQYDIYLDNWNNGAPVGNVMFPDITADLSAVKRACQSGDVVCIMAPSSFTGSLTIDSIVYDGEISINNLDIQIDGVLGDLVNWLFDFFGRDFVTALSLEFSDCDYTCQPEVEICNEEFYCCENLICDYLQDEDYGYCVAENEPDVPEFTTIGAGVVLVGIGLYLFIKRK